MAAEGVIRGRLNREEYPITSHSITFNNVRTTLAIRRIRANTAMSALEERKCSEEALEGL